MKRESFEVVIGGVVLDNGEFGVDEGEKQNVTLRPRQLHRLHRHHVAEKRKTRGAFQFPLPFAILLRRMRTLIITLTAVIFTLTAGTWNSKYTLAIHTTTLRMYLSKSSDVNYRSAYKLGEYARQFEIVIFFLILETVF